MIAIVGGGYAGAATALSLALRGRARDILLVEAEPKAGVHASGLNAGLMCALLDEDPAMAAVGVRGMRLLAERSLATRCGSVLLVPDAATADRLLERADRLGIRATAVETGSLASEIPLLRGAPAPVGVRCPDDAKIDPQALSSFYLEEASRAGVRVLMGARATGVIHRDGRAAGIETTTGRLEADAVVNAAGAWAGPFGVLAGLTDLGLVPHRRHLFVTAPARSVEPAWPFVWDLEREVYFRPDGNRLTLCVCDEEPHPAGAPEVSGELRAAMAALVEEAFPAIRGIAIESERACLRTFAPDRRYVVGPDPRMPGFFWVAGLGGSGAMAGAAIGEMAADLILGAAGAGGSGPEREFLPARLIEPGA